LLPWNLRKDDADFFFSPFYLRPFFCPVKSAIVLHDISYEAHPEWFDRKSQFVLKIFSKISAHNADLIFTVSEYSKNEIVKYYKIKPNKIVVTLLAPDSGFHMERNETKIRAIKDKYGLSKFVLCVGTIFTRRHIPEIIDAFDKFSENNGDYQLCVVGKNRTFPFEDVDAEIEKINGKFQKKKIVHLGFLEEDELMAFYSSCCAVIYLSDYEGFGLPVVEAQFFAKPVLTSHNTSLVEVGGESVEFVKKNEMKCILKSLHKVLEDKDYYNSLVFEGGNNIKRYNWRKCAERTLKSILKKG
jgi:glycosyltransferase involved in cell wall biosynthesis